LPCGSGMFHAFRPAGVLFVNLRCVRYYHNDRTHLALDKQIPASREATECPAASYKIVSKPRLGGPHHRYALALEPSRQLIPQN